MEKIRVIALFMIAIMVLMPLGTGKVLTVSPADFDVLSADINKDGVFDGADLTIMRSLLEMSHGNGIPEGTLDVTGDGRFYYDDLDRLTQLGGFYATGGSRTVIYVVGDVDGDGVFDFTDLDKLISNAKCHPRYCPSCQQSKVVYNQLTRPGVGVVGDVDGNGVFELSDYEALLEGERCSMWGCPWCGSRSRVTYNQITRIA